MRPRSARVGQIRPVLGSYAEYDAVPGNSQQVVPYRAPRAAGCIPGGRHTDAYLALGTTPRRVWQRTAMEKFGLAGRSSSSANRREGLRSKPVHAAKAITTGPTPSFLHPHFANTAVWDTSAAPIELFVFTFETTAREGGSTEPDPDDAHLACRAPCPARSTRFA